ncbi:YdaU family protein [Aerobium aerolatum]|uniref:Uncharacterized conserved protein YdaU, DUF1376 family n=1 Tax=Aquamicrobium aerolatum DSM 21857 TaxID=1121003 RepID=A0A1I3Q396_9HYPH|nr:DUF1376 domain-containing protein [Aquamicrobium aerolatum]SFJ28179.1 Uncharacterized conserved protein YdaU, DUF1376 family [Aquamicrobium aerolatum DSM 21857]
MSSMAWMPLYVGDYRADTTHLSAAQHGAYLLLIMHYWQQGAVPDDDEQLARIACMTLTEWRRNRPIIRAFFGDGWHHRRIDREMQKAVAAYEKRSRAGQKGNAKRWADRRNAIALGSQPQPQPHSLREDTIQGEQNTSRGMALGGAAVRLAAVNGGVIGGEDEL